MALYTRESRDRVRDAVDFVELVSARTDLRRAGQNSYEGLCPFHEERTPSFGIDPAQKLYYCFGCQAAGDVFTFVQETESVDFKGALELLADRCGIELEREQEDPKEAERRRGRERLLELLARTSAYYERCLWESEEAARARAYLLEERGLGEEILKEFRVGFAPSAWDRVLTGSLRNGFSEAELYAVGLVQRSREAGRVYDRFRARIMFPLADTRGRVLGFGARILEADPGRPPVGRDGDGASVGGRTTDRREERRPKYLNTNDNAIYHKGEHLYGADLARAHAARAGSTILCEGYTDVIALHQAGIRNTVGLMGTALTDDQVGELARMAPTVLMALDADSAGQQAMLRAAGLAAKRKLELRVVPLPAGADPAELVQREGGSAIERAIERSVPFVRFRVQRILDSGDDASAEGRDRTLEELRPVFATIPASALRMELTQAVSERLGLPESLAERTLAERVPARALPTEPRSGAGMGRRARDGESAAPSASARSLGARGEGTERAFLALCISDPDAGAKALQEVDPGALFANATMRRAVEHLREHLA
ncbi:MAG TPA: CHC2 zinc finger domain-containing protein, partial [Solirubrobacteraceae bacterium]|nr:CHC2 zinc finger domain-containing protein [Solirubrobacteraceae bacterium]